MESQIEQSPWVTSSDSQTCFGRGNLSLLLVNSPMCDASISLQGAQLLSFISKHDNQEMLWLSPITSLERGAAIRGGIPVCAPWFGVNRRDPSLPKHGFVRNKDWMLSNITSHDSGMVEIELRYLSDTDDLALFSCAFELTQTLILSDKIEQRLTLTNTSNEPGIFSWALHSYFKADSAACAVTGLEDRQYLDATRHFQPYQQQGALRFNGEVDRVYESCPTVQRIHSPQQKSIAISGTNCPTVITWNPGTELASKMADVQSGYRDYVCVERGAAFADEFSLAPGASLQASQTLQFEAEKATTAGSQS